MGACFCTCSAPLRSLRGSSSESAALLASELLELPEKPGDASAFSLMETCIGLQQLGDPVGMNSGFLPRCLASRSPVSGTTFIVLKAVAVGGKSMLQPEDDIEAIKESLSESAAFLLPLARETSWPCKPELLGWLTMVRDTFGKKDERDIH